MEEKKEDGACGKGGCGMRCGCCCCKTIKAVLLLLIGGTIGFYLGRGCLSRRTCAVPAVVSAPMGSVAAPVELPAPKKAK